MDLKLMIQTQLKNWKHLTFQRDQFKELHGTKFWPIKDIKTDSNILAHSSRKEKSSLKMDMASKLSKVKNMRRQKKKKIKK